MNAVTQGELLRTLPFARRYPVHTTVYNPLAGGLLSGRYTAGAPFGPVSGLSTSEAINS